jgi:hypothetical protein
MGVVSLEIADAAIVPRSLHYVTRRAKTARRKKPGLSGRDDTRAQFLVREEME